MRLFIIGLKFLALAIFLQSSLGFAQRSQREVDPDPIFKDPNNGGWFQVAAGTVDVASLLVIRKIYKMPAKASSLQEELNKADARLRDAHDIFTNDESKQKHIDELEKQLKLLNEENGKDVAKYGKPSKKLTQEIVEATEELKRVRNLRVLTVDEKAAQIAFYKAEVEKAGEAFRASFAKGAPWANSEIKTLRIMGQAAEPVVNGAKSLGRGALKVAKVGLPVILVVDVLDRVYVWNSLDKDPKWSPLGVRGLHYLNKTFGDKTVYTDINLKKDGNENGEGVQTEKDYLSKFEEQFSDLPPEKKKQVPAPSEQMGPPVDSGEFVGPLPDATAPTTEPVTEPEFLPEHGIPPFKWKKKEEPATPPETSPKPEDLPPPDDDFDGMD